MAKALQIGHRTVNAEELIPLLTSNYMLPQLLRETIIDRAIAPLNCTDEETRHALEQFYQQHQITEESARQTWLENYSMNEEQLIALATRKLRIEKFQKQTWAAKLESYFLKRKKQLDQAIYSLIRTSDPGIAHELYFRIQAGEQTFAELAKSYSIGSEAHTNGIVGPVELGRVHPRLANQLVASQPGQLWQPFPFEKCFVIVRLEKFIPSQLDKVMRQRLLRELFDGWLQEQINELPDADKAWMKANRKVAQVDRTNAA